MKYKAEILRFKLDDQAYSARVSFKDDYVLYQIYMDIQYFCTIGLNEECVWESIENVDQQFVRTVGSLIEDHTM